MVLDSITGHTHLVRLRESKRPPPANRCVLQREVEPSESLVDLRETGGELRDLAHIPAARHGHREADDEQHFRDGRLAVHEAQYEEVGEARTVELWEESLLNQGSNAGAWQSGGQQPRASRACPRPSFDP